ncbi:RES family NAD+ phosphorylase [Erwinia mallotivora]|uniref:Toxin n=1 Tax=Erwinia mallotivora TaxID=69222 RepID=A0A014LWP9_9GAMM|nr:RES family NAD+ phosphorylase [Erwinia mallotivora]EXU74026.1 toxin [Erwinia mallotivora]
MADRDGNPFFNNPDNEPLTFSDATVRTWPRGKAVYRVHQSRFGSNQFNPLGGDSRFSPCHDKNGDVVPALYGAINTAVAMMETIFHDIPSPSKGIRFDLSKIDTQVHSILNPARDLKLLFLSEPMLKAKGIKREDLLLCTAAHYCFTQQLSGWFYQDNPNIDGLMWSSKQHSEQAIMLFGTRVSEADIPSVHAAQSLLATDSLFRQVENLADEMGLRLFDGRTL